jgi:hypothetical protein
MPEPFMRLDGDLEFDRDPAGLRRMPALELSAEQRDRLIARGIDPDQAIADVMRLIRGPGEASADTGAIPSEGPRPRP